MIVIYSPSFARQLKALDSDLKELAIEKMDEFKDQANHQRLKVHKLHGRFKDCYSFSVTHQVRIIFEYFDSETACLLAVGEHDVYK